MADQVGLEERDGIALITLRRPPGNVLTAAMRRDLQTTLHDAIQHPAVTGIVLCGDGRGFSSGGDLSECDGAPHSPTLRDLCTLIENSPKPVVCALHGMALGAGFEVALAAHVRVAHRDTRLALPDVKLSMLPSAGTTQRLPRLLGAQKSLEMLLSGQTLVANDPHLKRLFQQLSDDSPVPQARRLARDLAQKGRLPKSCEADIGFSDPTGFQKSVSDVKAQLSTQTGMTQDILACVEASQLLAFEQGLAFEESLYNDNLSSPEARSARHLFTATHHAARPPARTKSPPGSVQHVALIGTGGLVGETALACVEAGWQVSVLCPDSADAAHLDDQITQVWTKTHDDPTRITTRQKRLSIAPDAAGVGSVDLVLDAGQGDGLRSDQLGAQAVWVAIKPQVDHARAGPLAKAGRALELTFYRPVHIADVVELSIPRASDPQAIATVLLALGRLRRTVIQTSLPAGAIGDGMSGALFAAACQLVAEGASPYGVDIAARDLGFASGPFLMMDQIGLSRAAAQVKAYGADNGLEPITTALLDDLLRRGRSGTTAGGGVYLHDPGTTRRDPDLPDVAIDLAQGDRVAGFDRSALGAALLGAVVNEAVALSVEGAVRRASDLDLLMVRGFGFDAARGGPLMWADLSGLFTLYQQMQALSPLSALWQPHAKLTDMIRNGQGFFGRIAG